MYDNVIYMQFFNLRKVKWNCKFFIYILLINDINNDMVLWCNYKIS